MQTITICMFSSVSSGKWVCFWCTFGDPKIRRSISIKHSYLTGSLTANRTCAVCVLSVIPLNQLIYIFVKMVRDLPVHS